MWKQYMVSIMAIFVLTPILCGVLYFQQNYHAQISKKVATASQVETFSKPNMYPLINQASPFLKMPQLRQEPPNVQGSSSNMPLKPYIPIPASSGSFPGKPGVSMPIGFGSTVPMVKSIIFSGGTNNVAILADGANDVMVEVGQETRWGSVEDITIEGVLISGTLYKTKTIM